MTETKSPSLSVENETSAQPRNQVRKHAKNTASGQRGNTNRSGKNKGNGGNNKKLKGKLRAKITALEQELDDARASAAEFPLARPARMKRRHWGVILSFFLFVLVPVVAVNTYLWTVAEDQYVSTTGFTVRSQENSGASDLLGGLASFASASTASDSDILFEFIQSQEMVRVVDQQLDLREHYSQHWPTDWAFAIWPDASIEQLVWYWSRVVKISYDSGSGLIEVQASAYDAEYSQAITQAILGASQTRINTLNEQARSDAMGYAEADLAEALERLKDAREALTQFRTRTQIVDPTADIQGRMGVMNNLQQQLAQALIDYDVLLGSVGANDPRVQKSEQRIAVIKERIQLERANLTSSGEDVASSQDYPALLSEYERLNVDLQFAEETYRAALTALDAARDNASRQSRYLATYISPSLAQEAEAPQRVMIGGLASLFLLFIWSIGVLIYYSIRDRS
ncbi:sugar transporter [Donghicola eburneus]|uniref:sugar transporter n=1 Tax=Donghicola eburneus TaxID=393278 RepID=UPI0008EF5946|nr:sugar transporter [Donghicola eburneus]SFQ55995.1 capsular polysaccharide transport system permease protein [Donghicola eburneus]